MELMWCSSRSLAIEDVPAPVSKRMPTSHGAVPIHVCGQVSPDLRNPGRARYSPYFQPLQLRQIVESCSGAEQRPEGVQRIGLDQRHGKNMCFNLLLPPARGVR